MRALLIFLTLIYGLFASDLANISTQRLAGQMLLIGFKGTSKNDYLVKKLAQEASLGKLGGIVFNGANLTDLATSEELINRFANIAVVNPLILALDPSHLEGDFEHLKSIDYANTSEPLETLRLSFLKNALEVFELGFNLIYAPNLSASTPGADLDKLSIYAQHEADAIYQAGLIRAIKEFPGAPEFAASGTKIEQYYLSWMKPFYDEVATQNAEIVVISNKLIRSLDPLRAASQSPKIHRILRKELGFNGLVASSDILGGDLDSQEFSERIIASINAGCDLLYFSQSVIKYGDTASAVVNIITKAVERGEISRQQLEQSYEKIIELKAKLRKRNKNS